jgi:hypothetical protein
VREWPNHKQFLPEQENTANDPLLDPQKIFLPPLHIKLGLMKNSAKAMENTFNTWYKFPLISNARNKKGSSSVLR